VKDGVSLFEVISTVLGVVTFVVGCSTAYLRLFVAQKAADLREDIRRDIEAGFARKELMEEKFTTVNQKLEELCARLERIEEAA